MGYTVKMSYLVGLNSYLISQFN